ncbi:ATP-binding protein [Seleniivibrio woodruffii]|uniref:ATP-binding protein n=1 Tax=Seleniivibrio woodruffii TaxID=1078050 RepID=UPI0039E3EDC0
MSKKILVVEDEAIIGLDIATRLERSGYTVIGLAVDDEEVHSILARDTPDLILMDISLKSSVDGIELVSELHRTRKYPVVYITSYSDSATISRSMTTSPYGYIIKPFTSQSLLATVSLSFTRIELEKSAFEKTELIANVLENTSDGIAVVDKDYNITMVNRTFCTITGMKECAAGVNIRDVLGGYDHSMGASVICLDNGTDRKTAVMGVSRFMEGSIATLTDITQTEIFRNELYIAEEKFASVFRKKFIPAVITSRNSLMIKDCNEALQKLYGMAAQAEGLPLSFLTGQEVMDRLTELSAEHSYFELSRVTQVSRAGREFIADFRGNIISEGENAFILLDIEDVSEKVRLENIEKELKIRMIQTNKMAALGTLVSGVAHELNNPNNFIMFNTSIIRDYLNDMISLLDSFSEPGRELMVGNTPYEEAKCDIVQLLEGVHKGSERIRDIVHDLKSFVRQETSAAHKQLSIAEPLKSAIHILTHKINKTTDHFSVEIAEELPAVNGNGQKLEQVFMNIIMNALEATVGRHLPVSVRCFTQEGFVVTEIADSGVGIREEDIQRITEPFFTTKQAEGGTGLGLAIVYSIVQDHKGRLEVTSERNAGTTVRILVPAGDA